ncbi:MAG: cyclic nucleotide-binding domain-containing protein [Candidatus Woesearchaeota archaeon]|jgi:CRP-like cAMP-binding protein
MATQTQNQGNFSILPILKKIPLFANLNEKEHADIVSHIELQFYPKNYVIFHEGDIGEAVYIIKTGLVQVFKGEGETRKNFAALGEGDFFGEMALMSDEVRSASVETVEDSEIFVLKKADFFELVQKSPDMASHLSEECLKRMKENKMKN